MQSGWNILSGTRGDSKEIVPSGSYKLVSLEKPYPAFAQDRRVGFDTDDFDEIKKQYGYRCATCGSKMPDMQ
jgi:predicted restriction endonuclease